MIGVSPKERKIGDRDRSTSGKTLRRHTGVTQLCDYSDVSTRQRMPSISRKHRKLEEA